VSDAQDPGVGEAAAPRDPEVDVEALLEDELVGDADGAPTSVEDLVSVLEATTAERDEYLDLARRTQAEFENHRKRVAKQLDDEVVRKVADLVEQLLPVLDACDGAVLHGATEVEPIFAALLQTLEKRGLERIDPIGDEFDPNAHEAVMHEPADEGQEATLVSDVMRAGYAWQGRVIRPAMVKVKG
jgi:molecular chaperone GrpE